MPKGIILMVIGFKNVGKTTLITNIVSDLRKRGYRPVVFKHIYHPDFKVDYEGKDTWKYIEAGSYAAVAISRGRLFINEYLDSYPDLNMLLEYYRDRYDIVILEGFKSILGSRTDVYKVVLGRDDGSIDSILKTLSHPIIEVIKVLNPSEIRYMKEYNNLINKILNLLGDIS